MFADVFNYVLRSLRPKSIVQLVFKQRDYAQIIFFRSWILPSNPVALVPAGTKQHR
jgi:hypothetical protein